MKCMCFFSVKLSSFAILKSFLTQFSQLVFAVWNSQPDFLWFLWQIDDLLRVGYIKANLMQEFSNVPVLFFIYSA